MATAPKRPDDELPRDIDVEAFLAWVEDRPGRCGLHGGGVVAMTSALPPGLEIDAASLFD